MKKINIAEILKNCPKGMELDCLMYDDVRLLEVDDDKDYIGFPIKIVRRDGFQIALTKYGQYTDADFAKCVIYPKGKTTWEGFVPPCKFKTGDVLFVDCSDDEDKSYQYIFILNDPDFYGKWHSYCHLDGVGCFHSEETYLTDDEYHPRFATEEEKAKLFDAIKENGYKWNEETKTLEKLVKPNFKVGDIIQDNGYEVEITKVNVEDELYEYKSINTKAIGSIPFSKQDYWKLVSNKFDITTLVPFESKVLVKDNVDEVWLPCFFGGLSDNNTYPYRIIGGEIWKYCIPYEGNEHLSGKRDDCSEYYKNW